MEAKKNLSDLKLNRDDTLIIDDQPRVITDNLNLIPSKKFSFKAKEFLSTMPVWYSYFFAKSSYYIEYLDQDLHHSELVINND